MTKYLLIFTLGILTGYLCLRLLVSRMEQRPTQVIPIHAMELWIDEIEAGLVS